MRPPAPTHAGPLPAGSLGVLAGLASVLLWASHLILGRAFAQDISPLAFVCGRWALAALCLFLAFGRRIAADFPLFRRHWRGLATLGLLGAFLSNGLGYLALHFTDAINVAILNANLPLMVALIGLALGRQGSGHQGLGRRGFAGLATATTGVLLLLLADPERAPAGIGLHPGDLLALAANLAWALYTVFYADLCPKAMARSSALFYGALPSVLLSFLLLLAGGGLAEVAAFTAADLLALAFAGIGVSFGAYLAYTQAVVALGPDRAANFLHLVPVLTAGLSFLWLGDPPSPLQVAAALVILVGLHLVMGGAPGAAGGKAEKGR